MLNFLPLPELEPQFPDVRPVAVTYSPESTQLTRPHQRDVRKLFNFYPLGRNLREALRSFQTPVLGKQDMQARTVTKM